MKRLFLIITFLLCVNTTAFCADFDFYNSFLQPGHLNITVDGAAYPYDVYISHDNSSWHLAYPGVDQETVVFSHLANGVTYYIRVVDFDGDILEKSCTTPLTVLNAQQLSIKKIHDTSVDIEWSYINNYYGVDVYVNGDFYTNCSDTVTALTIDNLSPDTDYYVHLVSKTGYVSNIIYFKTTNIENNFFNRLEDLLNSLFIPPLTDSNFDGLPDIYDGVRNEWLDLVDKSPIGDIFDVADDFKNIGDDFNGNVDMPNFSVTFAPGITINAFDFTEFQSEIEIFRGLMVAVIWVTFFMFLVQLLIPLFNL